MIVAEAGNIRVVSGKIVLYDGHYGNNYNREIIMNLATSERCRILDRVHAVTEYTLNGRKQFIVEKNPAMSGPIRRHIYEMINELNTWRWEDLYNYFDNYFEGEMPATYERMIDRLSIG